MTSFGVDYASQYRQNEERKNLQTMKQAPENIYNRYTDWCSSVLPADASICTVPPKRPQFMTQKNLMLSQKMTNGAKAKNRMSQNVEPMLAVQPGPTHHPGGPPEIYRRPPHSDMIQRRNDNIRENDYFKELKNANTNDYGNVTSSLNRRKNRMAKCQSMNVDQGYNYNSNPQAQNNAQSNTSFLNPNQYHQNLRSVSNDRVGERGGLSMPVIQPPPYIPDEMMINDMNAGVHMREAQGNSYNYPINDQRTKPFYADPQNISQWADQGRYEMEHNNNNSFYNHSPNNSDEIIYEFQNAPRQNLPVINFLQDTNQPPYVAIVAPDLNSLQNILANNFNGANYHIITPQTSDFNTGNNSLNVDNHSYKAGSTPPSFQQYVHINSPKYYEINDPVHSISNHDIIPPMCVERLRAKVTPKSLFPKPFSFQPDVHKAKPAAVQSRHQLNKGELVKAESEQNPQAVITRRTRKLQHSFTSEPMQQESKVLKPQHVREPKKIDRNAFINNINPTKAEMDTSVKYKEMILNNQNSFEKDKITPNSVKPTENDLRHQVGLLRRAKTVTNGSSDGKNSEFHSTKEKGDRSIVSVAERAKMWSDEKFEAQRRMSQGGNVQKNYHVHDFDFDDNEIGDENPMSVEDRIRMLELHRRTPETPRKSTFDTKDIFAVKANDHYRRSNSQEKQDLKPMNYNAKVNVAQMNMVAKPYISQPYSINKSAYQREGIKNNSASSLRHTRRKTQPITLEDLEKANQYILDGNESDIFDAISSSALPEGSEIFNLENEYD